MVSFVIAVPTPLRGDGRRRRTLHDPPTCRRDATCLHAWHERAGGSVTREIVVPASGLSRAAHRARRARLRRRGPHLNKFGLAVRGEPRGPVLMRSPARTLASGAPSRCRSRSSSAASRSCCSCSCSCSSLLSRWAQRNAETVVQRELEQSADLVAQVSLRSPAQPHRRRARVRAGSELPLLHRRSPAAATVVPHRRLAALRHPRSDDRGAGAARRRLGVRRGRER